MGDGSNATPGQHRAPGPEDDHDNQWLTRTPRPTPGAAPWERAAAVSAPAEQPETPTPAPESTNGNHTAGISVAELMAKLAADRPPLTRPRPRLQPRFRPPIAPPPADPPTGPIERAYADVVHADIAPEIPDLDALARRPAPARKRPARRRQPIRVAGRSLAAIGAVAALLVTGGAWQYTSAKDNDLNKVNALDPESRDIVDPNAQFGDENFLIVGVDSRYGANADMGVGTVEDAGGTRSDTVMLVNIPANRERVVGVSFPRDLAITPLSCEPWNPQTGEYGPIYDETSGTWSPDEWYTETKLNSAYAYGGPKCLVRAIQRISGISINRFMAIDFAGFSNIVDALGGVEVCSPTPLEDYELGTVLATAGKQTVNGQTALNYVRARQVVTEVNGDYGRIKRQQLFLSSLLRSLISKDTFFSLQKLNDVVNLFIDDSYVDNVTTKDLVTLGQSIQGVSAGRMTFVTVPTTGITDEAGNEEPSTDGIRALFDAIIDDAPLPGENDTNATVAPLLASGTPQSAPEAPPSAGTELVNTVTVDPTAVDVHVANGTEQAGLGADASTALQQYGFSVDTPDDYPQSLSATTVMYSSGNESAAATVAATLGNPLIEQVPGLDSQVQVVLGTDYRTIAEPLPGSAPVTMTVTHGTLPVPTAVPTDLPEDLTVTNGADITCE